MLNKDQLNQRIASGTRMAAELLQGGHEGEAILTYMLALENYGIVSNGTTYWLVSLSDYFGDEGILDQIGRCEDTIQEFEFLVDSASEIVVRDEELEKWESGGG